MEKYKQLCAEIKNGGNLKITVAEGFTKILTEHIKQISKTELEIRNKSCFRDMSRNILTKDPVSNQFYLLLSKCFEIFYKNNSKMAQLIYQVIPLLLTKLIQIQHRSQQLNACLLTIYNNQLAQYNKQGNLRKNIKDNSSIEQLYFQELGKHLEDEEWHKANPIIKLTSSNRNQLKAVLIWVWYSNIRILSQESISDFFHTVYIYCGGNQKPSQRGLSLFLLERKDDISLFKYSISDEQLKWILIALYDLAMQKQNYKYEILAVINMVHKKTANQCQFRFSEIAQSAIHLLQDQYANIF